MSTILNLTSGFTPDSGSYYSTSFGILQDDDKITVEATLSANGTVSIQQSLDEITWYDIADTSFTCSPKGMQGYVECQPGVFFRLKSGTAFVSAKILL